MFEGIYIPIIGIILGILALKLPYQNSRDIAS